MAPPHALVIPYPAQGHVIPLIELSYCLADRGFDVTFVNTEYDYSQVISAMSKCGSDMDRIHLISVPDGLGPGENRNNIGRLSEGLQKTMPRCLEDLIKKKDEFGGNKFTCMIVDQSLAYLLEVAKKTGLRSAAFFPAAAALLATMLSVVKLIEDKIIDADGMFNSYVCDIWKNGLRVVGDEDGFVSKEQIKLKLEELLGEDGIAVRALLLKHMANESVMEGGSSYRNLNKFIDAMK